MTHLALRGDALNSQVYKEKGIVHYLILGICHCILVPYGPVLLALD